MEEQECMCVLHLQFVIIRHDVTRARSLVGSYFYVITVTDDYCVHGAWLHMGCIDMDGNDKANITQSVVLTQ